MCDKQRLRPAAAHAIINLKVNILRIINIQRTNHSPYFVSQINQYPFKNIFDFTTAGDLVCVAAVERLPALHYSVDFIFLSFGTMGFIVELWNY